MNNEFNIISGIPYRMIPADIGAKLNDKTICSIKNYFNKFKNIQLTSIKKTILNEDVFAYSINDDIELYIYVSGIIIFVIKDEIVKFNKNEKDKFAVKYCIDRKEKHQKILNWKHKQSNVIGKIISDLRNIIKESSKSNKIRKSANPSWEYGGISYVMTISFIKSSRYENTNFYLKSYPEWLKKNFRILLDPSLVNLEDSMNIEKAKNDFNEIAIDSILEDCELIDYEKRKDISTFISWAAVAIFGNFDRCTIDEYLAIEIELQYKWFYTYCLLNNLPKNHELLHKEKIGLVELTNIYYEVQLCENAISELKDSSIPDRIITVQNEMFRTSGIQSLINNIKSRINFYKEALAFDTQSKQKKFSQTSELLLYFIAYVQIINNLYEFFMKYINNAVYTIITLTILFFMGCVVLVKKNK